MTFLLEFTTLLHLRGTLHGGTQLDRRVLLLHVTIHLHDLLVPVGGSLRHAAGLALAAFLLVFLILLVAALLLVQAACSALVFTRTIL